MFICSECGLPGAGRCTDNDFEIPHPSESYAHPYCLVKKTIEVSNKKSERYDIPGYSVSSHKPLRRTVHSSLPNRPKGPMQRMWVQPGGMGKPVPRSLRSL